MEEGHYETNVDSEPLSVHRDVELGVPEAQGEYEGKFCCNEEFEFRISVSRTQGVVSPVDLCPADDLFYKGQLLPLHLPPRLQMVQNLDTSFNSGSNYISNECQGENLNISPLSSTNSDLDCRSNKAKGENLKLSPVTSTSSGLGCISNEAKGDSDESVNSQSFWSKDSSGSSDSTSSRDSSGSSHDSSECTSALINPKENTHLPSWRKSAAKLKVSLLGQKKSSKIGVDEKALKSDVSSVRTEQLLPPLSMLSRDSSSSNRFQKKTFHSFSCSDECQKQGDNRVPREGFHKYLKMIKPLYEKISNKYDQLSFLGKFRMDECGNASSAVENTTESRKRRQNVSTSHLSGNSRIGRRSSGVGSCPSSKRSSPSHSGVLVATSDSAMEELQSAIQGAIAHCKKSNGIKSETPSSKDSDVSS